MAGKAKSPAGLELGLNLSPREDAAAKSAASVGDDQSLESSDSSSPAVSSFSEVSCVTSSEVNKEETKAMLLVGCLWCLRYFLLGRPVDPIPTCPHCKSNLLLDIVKDAEMKKKKKQQQQPPST